jgi:hypothetical protein
MSTWGSRWICVKPGVGRAAQVQCLCVYVYVYVCCCVCVCVCQRVSVCACMCFQANEACLAPSSCAASRARDPAPAIPIAAAGRRRACVDGGLEAPLQAVAEPVDGALVGRQEAAVSVLKGEGHSTRACPRWASVGAAVRSFRACLHGGTAATSSPIVCSITTHVPHSHRHWRTLASCVGAAPPGSQAQATHAHADRHAHTHAVTPAHTTHTARTHTQHVRAGAHMHTHRTWYW